MTSFPKRGKDVRNLCGLEFLIQIELLTAQKCHSFDGLNVFPEVWSLDSTEAGFEIGDYKLVK